MDYELDLHLPARPAYAVLVDRLLSELETTPGGPGSETALLGAALGPVVKTLLESLERTGGGGLDLHLEADDVRVQMDLAAIPDPGRQPAGPMLGPKEAALVAALEKTFDDVESRPAVGGGLALSLTRHIPC